MITPGPRYAARVRLPGMWGRGRRAESRIALRPGGPAAVGPLERFLTARWGFHAAHLGHTRYVPNAHPPWPLRGAELTGFDDGLVASVGLDHLVSGPPEHVVFSDGVAVSFAFPQLVSVSSKL